MGVDIYFMIKLKRNRLTNDSTIPKKFNTFEGALNHMQRNNVIVPGGFIIFSVMVEDIYDSMEDDNIEQDFSITP